MIHYVTEIQEDQWEAVVDLYDETNMFLGHGRERNTTKIQNACRNSYKVVLAWEDDKVIGAGRMVSDGECYAWIHDVTVLENRRKEGIGGEIIKRLMKGNEHLLIGLTSSFMAVDFYKELGFKRHKTAMAKYPGPSDYLHND